MKHWSWFHWFIPVPLYAILGAYRDKRDMERAHGRSFTREEFQRLTTGDMGICSACSEIATGIQLAAGNGLCDACYQAHRKLVLEI